MIPNVSAPGFNYWIPNFQYANKWLFQETQTKLMGRHTFRYGFEFVRQLSKTRPQFNERGALMYQNSVVPPIRRLPTIWMITAARRGFPREILETLFFIRTSSANPISSRTPGK